MTILNTRADVESAMNELQRLRANVAKSTALSNSQIAVIRDHHVGLIAPLEAKGKEVENAIEVWAEANRNNQDIFLPGKKSIELQAGTISFRAGTAKVVLRKKSKLKDVIAFLAATRKELWKTFLSQPDPVLDKSAVKEAFDDGDLSDEDLRAIGLEIDPGEETMSLSLKEIESYK